MATHELELSLQIADYFWMALSKDLMVAGTPEDLVLNSYYTKMINHEAIHFDEIHGRFIIKNETKRSCSLTGEKERYSLTRNALQRKGWAVTKDTSVVSIQIKKENKTYVWIVINESFEHKAYSIEELLQILNKL
jgi:iron complex transport system ATP-binding protein